MLAGLLLPIEHAEARAVLGAVESLSIAAAAIVRIDLWTLERDVARGDAGAELALATVYRRRLGVKADHESACRLYQRSSRNQTPYADYQVAMCIAQTNRGDPLPLLQRAAQAGHAGAQELVARSCLQKGDVGCALDWLCRAARQGRASAQSLLAWVYANGDGVAPDPKRAFFFYVLAAQSGELAAQNNLGEIFESGTIGIPDSSAAALWYKRAAKAGLAQAQVNLGRLYAQGQGLTKDIEMAGYWFRQAAEQGNDDATKLLQWLAAQPTEG